MNSASWPPGQGSASSGDYTEVSQQDVDQPLCLRQMTFCKPAPETSEASNEANDATNSPASRRDHTGILLWIER
ncbi:MAG: hypothetical protein R3C99_14060 [Pirellulaceae bacterium]